MKNPNVRKRHETQKRFRARRRKEHAAEKKRAKGTIIWYSSHQGTHIKSEHGPIGSADRWRA